MKILFLSNLYPPNDVGGYERLCFSIAQGMVDRGHEVVVLTSDYGNGEFAHVGQKVIDRLKLPVSPESIYLPFSGSEQEKRAINEDNVNCYREVLQSERPDLVFVWNLFFLDPSFFYALAGDTIKKVLFLTDNWLLALLKPEFIGTYMAQQVTDTKALDMKHFIKRYLQLYTSRKGRIHLESFHAIFSSNYMARLYKKGGITFGDTQLIYNGVELRKLREVIKRNRSSFVSEERISLFFAGRIVDVKGLAVLLRALTRLVKEEKYSNIFLEVIGDDSDSIYMKRINDYIEAHGIGSHLSFQKPVSEKELLEAFQEHDVFVFPSLYEPFSLTLLYALGSGIPTIASRTGGNPEIVRNGETGMLYDKFNDKKLARTIVALMNDHRLRNKISKNAMDCASKFGLDEMKDRIDDYLRGQI